jgi:hypothetical protein
LESRPQFSEREIWLLREQGTHLLTMSRQDLRLAAGAGMPMADLTRLPPLLEQFFHHAERHSEALGDVIAGAFERVVRGEDACSQVQRKGSHTAPYENRRRVATLLFKIL